MISPLHMIWYFLRDIFEEDATTFRIPAACGYSARDIAGHLSHFGIKHWGLCAIRDEIGLEVATRHARHAEYRLQQLGVPYTCGKVGGWLTQRVIPAVVLLVMLGGGIWIAQAVVWVLR